MRKYAPHTLILLLLCTYLALVWQNAWVADDAYISFRVVDNVVEGFGLRWNVDERVQVYSNPLWMLLHIVPYWLSGDMFLTTMGLSLLFAGAAFLIICRNIRHSPPALMFFALALCASPKQLEFATSGLEAPLLFFWIALFLHYSWNTPSLLIMTLIAAFSATTRLDSALFFLPALTFMALHTPLKTRLRALALGSLPLAFWLGFAALYYGFVFPNPYYAKLANHLPESLRLAQGEMYVWDNALNDPAGTLLLLAALCLGVWHAKHQNWNDAATAAGLLLGIAYIVLAGGDFMSGRFFVPLEFAATAMLARFISQLSLLWQLRSGTTLCLILATSTLLHSQLYNPKMAEETGIADEKSYYVATPKILKNIEQHRAHRHEFHSGEPMEFQTLQMAGFMGYFAGTGVHALDIYALTDPLLAHMPVASTERWTVNTTYAHPERWRVSHFPRAIPKGYVSLLIRHDDSDIDPALKAYIEKLWLVTRGEVFNVQRLKTILSFWMGRYDFLMEDYLSRFPQFQTSPAT